MARLTQLMLAVAILLSVAVFNVSAEDGDGDGWTDDHEESCNTDPLDSESIPIDSDDSGICDHLDPDDDNDGWWDNIEQLCGSDQLEAGSVPDDLDGDGICDTLDRDTDADGWGDLDEILCKSSPIDSDSVPLDLDGDRRCESLPFALPVVHVPVKEEVFLQPSTIQITVGGSAAIIAAGTVYSVEPVRWSVSRKTWMSFALMIGMVRKTRDGEFQRGRLYGYIESNPGIHLSALTRLSDLGNNQATYHLDRLEKEGRIWSRRDGRLLVFFADSVPADSSFPSSLLDINFSKNSIKRSILMQLNQADLMDLRGSNGAELAREIGLSPQVLSYHIRSLIDWGMVERKRSGLKVSIYITELGIEALTGIEIGVYP
ncbi:MAG: hypothetical protein P8Q46_03805 [Candidatus Thalassarchaeaceae archaeon]|nr:hypothetical protein [Candidatus Thalassarchaeaceae archaeon]